jgi:peptidyl-prolyl cis-trans isomerase C
VSVSFRSMVVSVSVCTVAFQSGCSGRENAALSPGTSVVAVIGSKQITTEDFLARLREQPEAVRLRYAPLERRKELLDAMVRQELLVQEARSQHLDQDPGVKAVMERMMVQQLIQRASAVEPSEVEARAFFEAHQTEFNRPERARVAHLLLPRTDLKVARAEAARVLARLRVLQEPMLSSVFAEEVRRSSTDASSRAVDGDLGLLTRDELTARVGPAAAAAAFELKAIGAVSAAVEDANGIHLLKLGGRQPGLSTSFAEARGRIASRLAAEARTKALESLVTSLRAKTKVEVHERALAELSLDGSPPQARDGG